MTLDAAHSMDTDWFCVDAEGEVAVMDSGEAGAVPRDWFRGPGLAYSLESLLPKLGIVVSPDDVPGPGDSLHALVDIDAAWLSDPPERSWRLLIETPRATLADRFPTARVVQGEGRVYLVTARNEPVIDELRDVWRRGLVTRAWAGAVEYGLPPSWFGVYAYDHDGYGVSHPYRRLAVPSRPLHLEDLPVEYHEAAYRLPVRFADQPTLQPARHVPCDSWQSEWQDEDGTVHPFD